MKNEMMGLFQDLKITLGGYNFYLQVQVVTATGCFGLFSGPIDQTFKHYLPGKYCLLSKLRPDLNCMFWALNGFLKIGFINFLLIPVKSPFQVFNFSETFNILLYISKTRSAIFVIFPSITGIISRGVRQNRSRLCTRSTCQWRWHQSHD